MGNSPEMRGSASRGAGGPEDSPAPPAILPDLLPRGAHLVFAGTAAGPASARKGAYYAGPGNRFWPTLHEAGFTPRLFRPEEFRLLPGLGIGLTDLCKRRAGLDKALRPEDFDVVRFLAAITACGPRAIAFTSKKAASVALGRPVERLELGEAAAPSWAPRVFVLPSPSAANGHWARQRHHWAEAARALGFAPLGSAA